MQDREARILFYLVAVINVGLFPFQSLLIICGKLRFENQQ